MPETYEDTLADRANAILGRASLAKEYRCRTILGECEAAGCAMTVDGGNLKVTGRLPTTLAQRIRDNKSALLKYLVATQEPWNETVARRMADQMIATRFEILNRASDSKREVWSGILDRIDQAWCVQDMAGFKLAIRQLMEAMRCCQ